MARVLLPLPDRDFDVTEVATPWHHLVAQGHEVVFATPSGAPGAADPLLLTGVVFGQLGAKPAAIARYHAMVATEAFQAPLRFDALDPAAFDGLLLPGGHAAGMRPYLESEVLRAHILAFHRAEKPIAAICHGVLALARTIDPETGHSVLYERRITGLLKLLEMTGYYLTAWKLGMYYRTYPTPLEDEVKGLLKSPAQWRSGPLPLLPFVMTDGHVITARWPVDAEAFADAFVARIGQAAP